MIHDVNPNAASFYSRSSCYEEVLVEDDDSCHSIYRVLVVVKTGRKLRFCTGQ